MEKGNIRLKTSDKNVRLKVLADGSVEISAPDGVDVGPILAQYSGWIEKKQAHFNAIGKDHRDFEHFFLINGTYVHLVPGSNANPDGETGELEYRSPAAFKRRLKRWLKEDLVTRADKWADDMGVQYRSLQIRMQKTRWGSCSSSGTMSINLRSAALPSELRDYLVIHELAHLKVPNHSALFWDTVAGFAPDYRAAEDELKRYWIVLSRNRIWRMLGEL